MLKIKSLIGLISVISSVITYFTNKTDSPKEEQFILSVNPFGNKESSFDTIKWYSNKDEYALFLPSDVDRNSLKIYFEGAETIKINNKVLHSGDTTDVFSNKDIYSVNVGKESYKLRILESENVPCMFLETKKPMEYVHANKDNKTTAKIRTFENGEMTLDSELKHIKGRGNSTWKLDKKPYNIKFDKKTALLGMDKAKKWTLLANHFDPVSNKNPIGWELAKYFDQEFICDYRLTDLYINNEYYGNYIVCDSVEIGESRVDIFDLTKATEKANDDADLESFNVERSNNPTGSLLETQWVNIPNDPIDITGGYLIECDFEGRARGEVSYFKTSRSQYYTIKEPEYASKKQVEYISNYFQEAEDAIASPTGYNNLGKHFTDYFDIDSLVNLYILLELSENIDSGLTSTFFYKDKGGKVFAGPLWDNDSAFGNIGITQGVMTTDPSKWVTNQNFYHYEDDEVNEFPCIFVRLFRLSYFRDKVNKRWTEIRKSLTKNVIDNFIDSYFEYSKKSITMNAYRWYKSTSESAMNFIVELSKRNLTTRLQYLDIGFSKIAAYLFYDVNGGRGFCTENRILISGQFATVSGPYNYYLANLRENFDLSQFYDTIVRPIKAPNDDMIFAGWNTKADGSGKTYLPGDSILMLGTKTLYAQWKVKTGDEPDYTNPTIMDDPILEFLESLIKVLKLFF